MTGGGQYQGLKFSLKAGGRQLIEGKLCLKLIHSQNWCILEGLLVLG